MYKMGKCAIFEASEVLCEVCCAHLIFIIFEHLSADSFKNECHQSLDLSSLSFIMNKVGYLFLTDFGLKSLFNSYFFFPAQWHLKIWMI